jgi:hypothetical protein
MRRSLLLVLLVLVPPGPALPSEIPDATIVLEQLSPVLPNDVPESAPPLFVLLKNGQLFRGGSGHVLEGKLEGKDQEPLDKEVSRVRKLLGIGSTVTFGPGALKQRLTLKDGKKLEIVASGDPAAAPPQLKPLASLIQELSRYDHPSLRPFAVVSYRVRVTEAHLLGGCRPWVFSLPFAEALSSPKTVPAAMVSGWPTGEVPASVCVSDKTYVVTLRPLLPGERF